MPFRVFSFVSAGKRVRVLAVLASMLASSTLFALAGCASATVRQPVATPTVAATSTPAAPPKIIFRSDWSHGAGIWKLPPHWTIQNGALVTDGLTQDRLPIPFVLKSPHYRVVMTWRMVDVTYKKTSCNNYFGLLSTDDSGATQYEASSVCFGPSPFHGDSRLLGADGTGNVWELTMGVNMRTSRVGVDGALAAYFPTNTGSIGSITNPQPNAPSHLYVEASQVKVVITSIVIWSL